MLISRKACPGPETYVAHVSLLGWVRLRDFRFLDDGLQFAFDPESPCPQEVLDRLVQDAVLNGVGTEAVFVSLEQTLQREFGFEPVWIVMHSLLWMMCQMMRHPGLRSLLCKHQTFKQVTEYCIRRTRSRESDADDGDLPRWNEWLAGSTFLWYVSRLGELCSTVLRAFMSQRSCEGLEYRAR